MIGPLTYDQFVQMSLNIEMIEAKRLVNLSDAVAIGNGSMALDNAIIDLVVSDPEERAKWKLRELRKEL